jgi:hypothetical protein
MPERASLAVLLRWPVFDMIFDHGSVPESVRREVCSNILSALTYLSGAKKVKSTQAGIGKAIAAARGR